MPNNELASQPYYDALARGREQGLIEDYRLSQVGFDHHGHLSRRISSAIFGENTRFLLPETRLLLEVLLETRDKLRVLLLGAGVGVESSEVSQIAEQYEKEVEIHAVAMTPVSPYHRINLEDTDHSVDAHDWIGAVWPRIRNIIEENGENPIIEGLLREREISMEQRYQRVDPKISLEALFTLQKHFGIKFFEEFDQAYITRQYINQVASRLDLPPALDFDLVHDNNGVLLYCTSPSRILDELHFQHASPKGIIVSSGTIIQPSDAFSQQHVTLSNGTQAGTHVILGGQNPFTAKLESDMEERGIRPVAGKYHDVSLRETLERVFLQ